MEMESDRDLLERMKSLIHVTKRVHVKDAAAMLDLDPVTFLKKVMEWGKTIPFKIDGDDIVVEDITAVIDSIDQQFTRWESGTSQATAKINHSPQISSANKDEATTKEKLEELVKMKIEAVLFVSGQAVSAEEIATKLNTELASVSESLNKLATEYNSRYTSMEIAKIADKYILQLKPEFTSSVKSFATGGLIREAVMRTLTIIAAKQPITMSNLKKIRVAAEEHVKELGEMGLVKAIMIERAFGQKSAEISTTDKFADMFGFSRDVNQMKEQIKTYLTAAVKSDELEG